MKRVVILLSTLLILSGDSYAARVTKPNTFSSGSTISSSDMNDNFDTIYNEFNGSIEGGASGNISADSLTELEMADDVNPRVRWDEGFQDYVYTGLQPATATGLTSNISAGTAYISGYRVNKASATSKTYTASKETVVDLGMDGTFDYIVQSVGDTPAAVAADHTRLAYVGTDAANIDSVTDMRTLTPYSTGSSAHIITRGFELEWAGLTKVTVLPGDLYHNVTLVTGVSTTLDITSASNYISGVSERGASKWLYVYSNSSGTLKLDDSAPAYADTDANTTGTKYYYLSSSYYRCLGAIRLNASQNIIEFYQQSNCVMYSTPITIVSDASPSSSWSGATACNTSIPAISQHGIFFVGGDDAGSNGYSAIRPVGAVGSYISGAVRGDVDWLSQVECFTDSSQQINYYGESSDDHVYVYCTGYYTNIR